ncbi:MAG: Crp/Fnr family transcriptional regulator [Bryobacterales bacterium]|nr:Crp/Fnr family transcriptional regulator [Bryobacterales bacterium]
MLPQSPEDSFLPQRGTLLADLITKQLLPIDGVERIEPGRRMMVLYRAADTADHVYFIESGLVKIVREGPEGRDLLITIAGAGEIFGEESLFGPCPRETRAEMLSDGIVYAIPAAIMLEGCHRNQQAWEQLAAFLARRGRALERKLDLLFLRDVEQRILQTLLELSEIYGRGEGSFSIHLSQSEMASLIGATRETTSTTLNAMARQGIITLGRRVITVPSFEALLAAARQSETTSEAGVMTAGRQ